MKIYCVRHGEARHVEEDPERALTVKGRAEVISIATYLGRCGIHVSHIMHSPKLRAKQTAEIMAQFLNIEQLIACENILDAEAPTQPLTEMIKTWHDDAMLVGHLPFMYKIINALILGDENYFPIVNLPPSAIVCLEYSEDGRWLIRWLLLPTLVPQL